MLSNAPKPYVSFRPVKDEDQPFLQALYAGTREWEFAHSTWTRASIDSFLKGQFDAQTLSYSATYPGASFMIIELNGAAIGRLTADRQDDCLRVIDLIIAPQWQGQGIGTDILRSLLNEAHGGKVPVRLFAEKANQRALELYRRHDFVVTGELPGHYALEWRPNTGPREI